MKEDGKMRLKSTIYESTLSTADAVPLPQWGRQIGGGFAEIDDEVATVLTFVISSATFLAAQDDETGRCPKVVCKSLITRGSQSLIPAFKLLGIPFSRIVISSVSEKSFLQADKRCMCESRNTQHQGVVSLSMPM